MRKTKPAKPAIDAEMQAFAAAIESSIRQAKAGEYARVTTPEQLEHIAARKRGRPVGSVKADAKQPVKLRLDPDVLTALREAGDGWQTRINNMLRASLQLAGRL
jgi:uncharacterized protein (DUF4415 family)